jgi:hypothetical protein
VAVADTAEASRALMEAQEAKWEAEERRRQATEELEATVAESVELQLEMDSLQNMLQSEREAHSVSVLLSLTTTQVI